MLPSTRAIRIATAAALLGAGAMSPASEAAAKDVAPVRYWLHSATGSYRTDALGTPPYSAPAGSTLSTDKPARATSATALAVAGPALPGTPATPTFKIPFAGTVRSLCLDLFIQADTRGNTNPPAADGPVYIYSRFFSGDVTSNSFQEANTQVETVTGTGVHRITAWAFAQGKSFEVTAGQPLALYGRGALNPDWTLHYDSPVHYSSITPNLSEKKCTQKRLPPPK